MSRTNYVKRLKLAKRAFTVGKTAVNKAYGGEKVGSFEKLHPNVKKGWLAIAEWLMSKPHRDAVKGKA